MGKTFQDLLNNGQAQVLGIVSPVPMGNWLSTTQYQKLNLVRHNTATYIARTSNQNIEPGVADNWATYWMLICIDGGQVSPDGEYPEMSVGSVMHALLWGNKSYDGSSTQTITAADLGLADVYKPQGSIAFASLPATPNESNYGYVWNITNDFTTDSRFIEGAGKKYSAGTNVGVINQDGQYYYDILGNFVDLSNYAKQNGTYRNLIAGGVDNVGIGSTTNINDYYGADYWGKEYYFGGGNNPQGSPEGISGGHLSVIRAGLSTTIQVIRTGVGSDFSGLTTTYQRNWNGSVWADWEEIVTSDGSYPNLGAGYLSRNSRIAAGSSNVGWWKVGSIDVSKVGSTGSTSTLLSVLGLYPHVQPSGYLEIKGRMQNGVLDKEASPLYITGGNLYAEQFCLTHVGTTISLYAYLGSQWVNESFTILRDESEGDFNTRFFNFEPAFYGTSAPSGAIYAVNRNIAAKVENALTIIKDGVSTVYDGSEVKTVEITENGGITVIEIPANDSGTLTSEQLQQVKNNPQNTVLRRTYSPEINEIYCFDSVNMTQGADSAYTFRNVTSMAQDSLTLQAITVGLNNGGWVYSSVQTSAGGGGGSGITIVTIPQDGVSTNPVMSGTIELASPENTVIKIYNGEDNDGARYTYSILTSFDENASGDVPEYVYSGEDYIVTCTKSNGNTYNYTLTETPTPSVDITYATDSDIEALFSGGGVTDELLGTWVLNDSPSILFDERTEYSVSFTSNSSNFTLMSKDYTRTAPNLIYGDMTVCSNNSWTNTAYKTITITDTSNLTNREAFTTWLKANATKQ